MDFLEVSQVEYKNFVLNPKINSWGWSEGGISKIYLNKEVVAWRNNKSDSKCFIREDCIEYCK